MRIRIRNPLKRRSISLGNGVSISLARGRKTSSGGEQSNMPLAGRLILGLGIPAAVLFGAWLLYKFARFALS